MRREAPVHRLVRADGRSFWYLTRYADVRRALLDPRLGRELERLPPVLAAPHRRHDFDPLPALRRNVFNLDPPDHTRLHRLVAPALGPRQVAAARPRIGALVDRLVEDMAAGEDVADVVGSLAQPLPLLVVAELIGFPAGHLNLLRAWSHEMLRSRHAIRIARAGAEFTAYVEDLLDRRRRAPADDLVSRLATAEEAGTIDRAEAVSTVFQLLFAGDETTVNLIGNTVLELLRHPDQLALLRGTPELVDSAVEEALRFNGPVGHSRPVYALDDLEYGGVAIPRGDVVVPVLHAANRDPAAFPAPDTFDITRDPNRHLGFGHGVHFCTGAALARSQARAAVGAFVRRFADARLAVETAELEWTPELFLHGVVRLPVCLGSR